MASQYYDLTFNHTQRKQISTIIFVFWICNLGLVGLSFLIDGCYSSKFLQSSGCPSWCLPSTWPPSRRSKSSSSRPSCDNQMVRKCWPAGGHEALLARGPGELHLETAGVYTVDLVSSVYDSLKFSMNLCWQAKPNLPITWTRTCWWGMAASQLLALQMRAS